MSNRSSVGDCYKVAGDFVLSRVTKIGSQEFIGTPHLVHAQVEGQGKLSGVKYGHAWIEDDVFVYDYSNGRELIFPKALYYKAGQVEKVKPKYYKYTFGEATKKMIESGYYGCWDLKTESGL